MKKKHWIAVGSAFVALTVLEFLFHEVLLRPVYMRPHYVSLWNPPDAMHGRMWAMFLAHLLISLAFVKVYSHGFESQKPPLGQGVRYGLWVALLAPLPNALMSYFVYPVSCKLAGTWAVGGALESLALGALVSVILGAEAGRKV